MTSCFSKESKGLLKVRSVGQGENCPGQDSRTQVLDQLLSGLGLGRSAHSPRYVPLRAKCRKGNGPVETQDTQMTGDLLLHIYIMIYQG